MTSLPKELTKKTREGMVGYFERIQQKNNNYTFDNKLTIDTFFSVVEAYPDEFFKQSIPTLMLNENGKMVKVSTTVVYEHLAKFFLENVALKIETVTNGRVLLHARSSKGYYVSLGDFADLITNAYITPAFLSKNFKISKTAVEDFILVLNSKVAHENLQEFNQYLGTEYLLFNNGVYSFQDRTLLPFNDEKLIDVDFRYSQMHGVDYVENPKELRWKEPHGEVSFSQWFADLMHSPVTPGKPVDKKTDSETYSYNVRTMGLTLFSGISQRPHLIVHGDSGIGKGFLGSIIGQILTPMSATIGDKFFVPANRSFLSSDFDGSTINDNTNLIWIDENNTTRGLTKEEGDRYNQYANPTLSIQIKGQDSKIITPPMLVLDGTQWVTFSNASDGQARRTLTIDLGNRGRHRYGSIQSAVMNDTEHLASKYVAREMIQELQKIYDDLDDFVFNFQEGGDISNRWITEAAENQRQLIFAGDSTVNDFFDDVLGSIPDDKNQGKLNIQFIWELQVAWHKQTSTDTDGRYAKQKASLERGLRRWAKRQGFTMTSIETGRKGTKSTRLIPLENIAERGWLPSNLTEAEYRANYEDKQRRGWFEFERINPILTDDDDPGYVKNVGNMLDLLTEDE